MDTTLNSFFPYIHLENLNYDKYGPYYKQEFNSPNEFLQKDMEEVYSNLKNQISLINLKNQEEKLKKSINEYNKQIDEIGNLLDNEGDNEEEVSQKFNDYFQDTVTYIKQNFGFQYTGNFGFFLGINKKGTETFLNKRSSFSEEYAPEKTIIKNGEKLILAKIQHGDKGKKLLTEIEALGKELGEDWTSFLRLLQKRNNLQFIDKGEGKESYYLLGLKSINDTLKKYWKKGGKYRKIIKKIFEYEFPNRKVEKEEDVYFPDFDEGIFLEAILTKLPGLEDGYQVGQETKNFFYDWEFDEQGNFIQKEKSYDKMGKVDVVINGLSVSAKNYTMQKKEDLFRSGKNEIGGINFDTCIQMLSGQLKNLSVGILYNYIGHNVNISEINKLFLQFHLLESLTGINQRKKTKNGIVSAGALHSFITRNKNTGHLIYIDMSALYEAMEKQIDKNFSFDKKVDQKEKWKDDTMFPDTSKELIELYNRRKDIILSSYNYSINYNLKYANLIINKT